MDLSKVEKMSSPGGLKNVGKPKWSDRVEDFWNERVMERFIKANLFVICCVAAAFLLLAYLAAFSCEVSWILEAHGDLPISAYILCTQFFVVFVATTILIHGLVTGIQWGLFAWSTVIGILSIPELAFVMIMTTQHWGLQSVHGLTELISYLIRLVINCLALICVVPTGLKWRRESQVLTQLQSLATRLQLQTPPPSAPITKADSRRASKRSRHHSNSFDNPGFMITESGGLHGGMVKNPPPGMFQNNFGSQNEFNASIFAMPQTQYYGGFPSGLADSNAKRAQSLMDLRCTLPGMFNSRYVHGTDDIDAHYPSLNTEGYKNSANEKKRNMDEVSSIMGSLNDPIYCTIEPKTQKLSRNCVSLENLDGITKIQNDLYYGNNLLQNYHQQLHHLAMMGYPLTYQQQLQQHEQLQQQMMQQQQQQPQQQHSHHHQHHNPQQQQQQSHHHHNPQHQRHHQYYPPQYNYYSHLQDPLVGCGGVGYGGFTNPYVHGSGATSKQSLGNESDDYRKYRDVAL